MLTKGTEYTADEDVLNEYIKVRYLGENDPLMLLNGKVYDARILKKGWYGIIDETNEEYAYPPELFEYADGLSEDMERYAV